MTPREIFLQVCNEIAEAFVCEGFSTVNKGQTLRKTATDNDLRCEIDFQSSHLNSAMSITVRPHFSIYSKALKRWEATQPHNGTPAGLVFTSHIGKLSPYNSNKEWNVAGMCRTNSVDEIINTIRSYIIPITNIFADRQTAIAFLQTAGTRFNRWTKASLQPMAFMICFGGKEAAQLFLTNYCNTENDGNRIRSFYNDLATQSGIDFTCNEFYQADKIKLAFVNGITI